MATSEIGSELESFVGFIDLHKIEMFLHGGCGAVK